MTTIIPNCDTCCHYVQFDKYIKRCEILTEQDPTDLQIGIPYHIRILGCVHHLTTVSYINQDVLKELRRLSKLCDERAGFESQKVGYEKAISLITDRV